MAASDLPAPSQGAALTPGAAPTRGREAEGEDRRTEALGSQLLIRLSAVIRTAKTHDVSNQAFQRQLQEFLAVAQALL